MTRAIDRFGRIGRGLTGVFAALLAVLIGITAVPAAAQEGEPDDDALTIFGTLEHPEAGPVEGARIEVRLEGEIVGEAESDAEGAWAVEVPGAGTYEVELDTASLPDGVMLRDPERNVLPALRVLDGRDKRANFSLGERGSGAAGAVATGNRYAMALWTGLVVGLVIALTSIGLSLVFGATGLVNFAHGEMVTFGALIAWFFNSRSIGPVWPLLVAGALAVVVSGAFGALQDAAVWRRMERRQLSLVSMMIFSIGLSMALRYLYAVVFNSSPRPFRQYAAQRPWDMGLWVFPPKQFAIAGIALAVIVLYATVLQRSRLGTAIRAVADNRDLAESSGIDVKRVVLLVWVVGSGLAGLGGVVYATLENGVQWDMGYTLLLPIFAAVVLGGIGTAYGPLVGGLVIGLVSELSTLWFPPEFKFAWGLLALIVVLIVRPQGILGRRERIG